MNNPNNWTLKESLKMKTYLKDVDTTDASSEDTKKRLLDAQNKFFDEWGLAANDGKIHVLMVAGDYGGCGFVRCESVSKYLNREQDIVALPTCKIVPELLSWAHIVVWQRQYKEELKTIKDACKKYGRKQIYEIDDNLHAVPESNPAYITYNKNRPEMDNILDWMKDCDLLTVSRQPLGEFYNKKIGKDFVTLENCIDFELYNKPKFDKGNDQIRIGWVGSSTHFEDLEIASYGINRILDEYGDRVKFVMMGWDGVMRRGTKDNELMIMGDSLDGAKREFHKFVDIHEYPKKLESLNLDIAIAPLADNVFNEGKSPIKFLEYSACGVPVVVSKISTYTDYIKPGETALVAKREADWYNKIKFLIENKEERIKMAEMAYNEVRNNFSFTTKIDQWANLYRNLLKKKELKYEFKK